MKYILLPIVWNNVDDAILEDLGIDIRYQEAEIKEVYVKPDEIKWFFADRDPNYTCIHLSNTEMVVELSIDVFHERLKACLE